MRAKPGLSRRNFLGSSAATVVGAAVLSCNRNNSAPPAGETHKAGAESTASAPVRPERSKVVLIRDPKVLDGNRKVDAKILGDMLDRAVTELVGKSAPDEAWGQLIKPGDTVGIKSNEWSFLRTPRELEEALRQRVVKAGVSADRISVRDRQVLSDPVFQAATALVNVRPLRTHHWSGVGTCIKNYILFHPNPAQWHDNACENLGGIWRLPIVEGKTRLNILVMLSPLFHGKGPHHFHAEYTWNYNGLIVGFDPVAVDTTGVRILEAKRREHFGEDQPFSTAITHLEAADRKYRLGHADLGRIDVVKLGWSEGVLI